MDVDERNTESQGKAIPRVAVHQLVTNKSDPNRTEVLATTDTYIPPRRITKTAHSLLFNSLSSVGALSALRGGLPDLPIDLDTFTKQSLALRDASPDGTHTIPMQPDMAQVLAATIVKLSIDRQRHLLRGPLRAASEAKRLKAALAPQAPQAPQQMMMPQQVSPKPAQKPLPTTSGLCCWDGRYRARHSSTAQEPRHRRYRVG